MKKGFLFFLLFFSCFGCSNKAGTGVSNPPTRPTQSLIPDFEASIPQTALTAADDNGAFEALTGALSGTLTKALTGPASSWTNIVLDGPMRDVRYFGQYNESLGDKVVDAINNDTNFGITQDVSSLVLEDTPLVDLIEDLTVDFSWYDSSEEFIKMVVRDNSDRIKAFYLVSTDGNDNPQKGFFAFANPDLVNVNSEVPISGARFLSFAFNNEDPTQNRMLVRAEVYADTLGYFVVWQIHYQCNTVVGVCLGEFLEINTNPSTEARAFSPNTIRFKWSEANGSVCVAPTTYDGINPTTLGETQEFFGPSQPSDGDVTTGTCTIDTPSWDSKIYSEADLLTRIEDTNGSTDSEALQALGDGGLDGWEEIVTPEAIDVLPFGVL